MKEAATRKPHTDVSKARRGAVALLSTVGVRDPWEVQPALPVACPCRLPIHTHHCKDNGETKDCAPGEGVSGTKEQAPSVRPRGLLPGADHRQQTLRPLQAWAVPQTPA